MIYSKLEKLGKIGVFISEISNLYELIENFSRGGLFLTNENSMIDTFRIDEMDRSLVGPQSVDLDNMTGNRKILSLIDLMKRKEETIFFPGTLLRDFGGYSLSTMPIIHNGRIIQERVKQTGIPYVDDYTKLARIFYGNEYAEKVNPLNIVIRKLKSEVDSRRKKSLKACSINELNVFPIICNELSLIPDIYSLDGNDLIDVILHSSDSFNKDSKEMFERYEKMLRKFEDRIREPLILIAAEYRDNDSYCGKLVYENRRIREI